MTKITRTYDPADLKLVPVKLPYRSRLGMSMALHLDDQKDKEVLEKAWSNAVSGSPEDVGEPQDEMRIPTLDEATRFIKNNPETTAEILGASFPRDAAESALAWLERWAMHVGKCPADENCTCGLVAVRHELRAALTEIEN